MAPVSKERLSYRSLSFTVESSVRVLDVDLLNVSNVDLLKKALKVFWELKLQNCRRHLAT